MPALSITLNVTPYTGEDLAEILADLGERLDGFATVDPYPVLDTDTDDGSEPDDGDAASSAGNNHGWTQRRADKFLGLLRPDARKALHYIASNAPEVDVADVIAELELDNGIQLGGRMSSMGHAMRRMPKNLTWPVERDRGIYMIEPEVAEVLLEAFERYAAKHAT